MGREDGRVAEHRAFGKKMSDSCLAGLYTTI
jgi:hypothetical protein